MQLEPLGSPIPDDAVAALRGHAGALGNLSVPLSWGTAVPADPEPVELALASYEAEPIPGALVDSPLNPDMPVPGTEEWDEWQEWAAEWEKWEAANAEPRFDMPRNAGVIPKSPAAG